MQRERNSKPRQGYSNKIDITGAVVYGKVPPQAPEIEKAVLGAIMLERDAIDTAVDYLTPEVFYSDIHAAIFSAMLELKKATRPIDELTTIEKLREMNRLDDQLTPHYLTTLTNSIVSGANMETHCRILLEKFLYRELIRISGISIEQAYAQADDVFDLIDHHAAQINSLADRMNVGEERHISTVLVREMQRITDLRQREDHITGVPTGWRPMDKTTGGWQDTDLIIIAARPSVGKTAFALNCARHAAQSREKPTPVGVLSMEMSEDQLVRRLMSAESDIDLEKLNNPKLLSWHELVLLYENGVQKLATYGIHIDDTPSLSLLQAKAKARKMKKKYGIGLLIIDYLQLMSGDTKSQNRDQELSTISRGLKALAKELKIPIIALSQLSRDVEKRGDHTPRLSDLRESGAIEQDADIVVFLTRQDYQQGEGEGMASNQAEAHFKKHRNGPLCTMPFYTALNVQRWMTPMEWDTYQRNKGMSTPNNLIPLRNLPPTGTEFNHDPF